MSKSHHSHAAKLAKRFNDLVEKDKKSSLSEDLIEELELMIAAALETVEYEVAENMIHKLQQFTKDLVHQTELPHETD